MISLFRLLSPYSLPFLSMDRKCPRCRGVLPHYLEICEAAANISRLIGGAIAVIVGRVSIRSFQVLRFAFVPQVSV